MHKKIQSVFVHALLVIVFMVPIAQPFTINARETEKAKNDNEVKDYIVVLKDGEDSTKVADEMAKHHGITYDHTYERVMKGFSAHVKNKDLSSLKKDPRVAFLSEDKEVNIFGKVEKVVTAQSQSTPSGVLRIGNPASGDGGAAIGVAVLDTGIDLTHPDLAANIAAANKSCIPKKTAHDDNGHGSHVAGTIAAINNGQGVIGVAPDVRLFSVKVLNSQGSGTWSSIICGIDWVTANASKYNIKVANMSLGGTGTSDNNCGNTNGDALHKAICKSRDAGVTYVVAAGNGSANAANTVPAAYDDAVITVSALADSDGKAGGTGPTTSYGPDDTFASFSNYGSVVDIAAPGVSILSTYKSGGYATLSGTSMATPHVTASAALYLESHPLATWTQVRDGLKSIAETVNNGHTDPSGNHPEPVLNITAL